MTGNSRSPPDDDPVFEPPTEWRRKFWDPDQGDPWMGSAAREAYRARRHARWRALLTTRDKARIRALADQVTPHYCPARLDDLDARGIAVGVGHPGASTNGERIGSLLDGAVDVLVWPLGVSTRGTPRA